MFIILEIFLVRFILTSPDALQKGRSMYPVKDFKLDVCVVPNVYMIKLPGNSRNLLTLDDARSPDVRKSTR